MKYFKEAVITIVVLVGIVCAVGVYTFLSSESARQEGTAAALSLETTEEQVYTTLDGEPIDLRQFDGKVRVVNSWASWCPFCVNELPDFATLSEEFAADDVVVLAINRKEDPRLVEAYLKRLGDTKNIIFVLDAADTFYKKIGGFAMPETIFYDKSGNVIMHKRGHMSISEMRTHTEAALQASNE